MSGPQTSDPTVNDDSSLGYSIGSIWANTTSDLSFICLDASAGAAVWKQITAALNNLAATAAPAVTNDDSEGYSVGSAWIDVTNDEAYVCLDASTGAAVWKPTTRPLDNLAATANPAASNDSSEGYSVGSRWVNVTTDYAYMCVDASSGAAVWKPITPEVLNNYAATADPTANEDSSDGYSIGSMWVNASSQQVFICLNASTGAAVWKRLETGESSAYGFLARDPTTTAVALATTPITNYAELDFLNGNSSDWNATTGVYTVPATGLYFVGARLLFDGGPSAAANTEISINIQRNGTSYGPVATRINQASSTTVQESGTVAFFSNFTAGDQVRLAVYQATGANRTTHAYTYLSMTSVVLTGGSSSNGFFARDTTTTIPNNLLTVLTNWVTTDYTRGNASDWNPTTGVYTVPETGIYYISGSSYLSSGSNPGATTCEVVITNGGVILGRPGTNVSSATYTGGFQSGVIAQYVYLTAGNQLDLRVYQNTGVTRSSVGYYSYFNVLSVGSGGGGGGGDSGSSVTCGMFAYKTTGQSIPFNTETTITGFDTPGFDTHSAFNTSTGVYTAPFTGIYQVSAAVQFEAGLITAGRATSMYFVTNSVISSETTYVNRLYAESTTANSEWCHSASTCVYLEAGKTVELRIFQNFDSLNARSLASGFDSTYFSVVKCGGGTGSDVISNFSATADPTTNDDSGDGYSPGSQWVNVSADRAFICVDAASGAANWVQIGGGGPLGNYGATADPTVNDDSGSGYGVGSHWVNVTADTAFICLDASSGAAVWQQLGSSGPLGNYAATAAPGASNDTTEGYSVGSHWFDVTNDKAYVCLDASTGAAIWLELGSGGPQGNYTATADPAASNDNTEDYSVGSHWVNVSTDAAFICLDASTGAAVWKPVTGAQNNFAATAAPGTSNDGTQGYSVGSSWVDVSADLAYVCLDASTGAAVWKLVTGVQNNFAATAAPGTSNDGTQGYAVGSSWINVSSDEAYVCLDASTGAAVWKLVTGPLNNLAATASPTAGDDSADGYAVGSVWINTSSDLAYLCLDASAGAAVWLRMNSEGTQAAGYVNWGFSGNYSIAASGNINFSTVASNLGASATTVNLQVGKTYLIVGDFQPGSGVATLELRINNVAVRSTIYNLTYRTTGWSYVTEVSSSQAVTVYASINSGPLLLGTRSSVTVIECGPHSASPLNNFAATTDPTVNDDAGDGYSVGSEWINTTAGTVFKCTNPAAGSAVWRQTSN